ncbi:MAG: helix-turn-helix transcriptional regulator [Aquisalimonadaceae bacterium]
MAACASVVEATSWPAFTSRNIIDAIGRESFFSDLFGTINDLCGIDHCAVFQFNTDALRELGSGSLDGSRTANERAACYLGRQWWRRDPTIIEVKRAIDGSRRPLVQLGLGELPAELRSQIYADIRDRVVICGQRCDIGYCLSLLRTTGSGEFSADDIAGLREATDAIISVVAKHTEAENRRPHLALSSLAKIEASIFADARLSQREAEVCARILYGLSFAGIGLDLGIGEETVKTYRNRAYQRLGIGSPRELLMWYLSIWIP